MEEKKNFLTDWSYKDYVRNNNYVKQNCIARDTLIIGALFLLVLYFVVSPKIFEAVCALLVTIAFGIHFVALIVQKGKKS